MKVTSKINIDLRHPNPGVRVDAVQGDVNTRAVEISLFDGGSSWKVPSGVTAALAYKKPDSQQGCLDKSASVTVSGSAITIVMTKQMLATPGTVNACVVLTDASKNQLTAFPFSVSVAANPAADVQQSDEPIKVDTSDATAAAGDIVAGKTAYVDGKKVTGTHACPEGLDTSDATAVAADILSGKTAYVNGQKVTGSIASRSAQTITPGTADQIIASGQYLSGKQTIKGDANLLPGNIKSGVTVFGVDGAYVGTVDIDTSDATAAAEDITKGKTAYVNGQKITGTHECAEGLDTSDATATSEDIAKGKTAYVNGQKVTGIHECAVPSLQSKTVIPSESQQTVSPDSGYDGLSSVTVGAVSRTYVGSGVTKKSAATYTPGTADQTIASGQYLSGKQTIKGDANLLAENIKSGVSIFGINGSFEASNSGKYAWEKYEVLNYEITKTSLGTTKPSDCGSGEYSDYSITDDGYFKLSGNTYGYGYHYISGQSSNAKSIYSEFYVYGSGGGSTGYQLLTLSDNRIDDTKGRKLGYVVSDASSDYPEDGVQDGFWYVKITG